MTKRLWLVLSLVACACPSKQAGQGTTGGSGAGSGTVPVEAGSCAGVRSKVEQLYRAEAQVREPKRVEEAVTDNTAMVMRDCDKAPDKVSACIARAATVADIETTCIAPLDDEGSEGKALSQ